MKGNEKTRNIKMALFGYIMTLPAFLIILGIIVYPIINAIIRSFQIQNEPGAYGFDNYIYLLTNNVARANILYTLYVVVITVILSTVIAFGLALYIRFGTSGFSKAVGALYLLPRFVPGLVAVNAMITVIRDNGLINRVAMSFGGSVSLGLMFTERGLILMNLWFNIPFATMITLAALSGVQDNIIESARDAGAGKWTVFRRIILPLTMRDVMIAATFIFMGNVGSFSTPYLMGGNFPRMAGIALFDEFNKLRYERAAALSVVMFLMCLISAVVYISTNMKKAKWETEH